MNKLSYIFIGSTVAIIAIASFFVIWPLSETSYRLYKDNEKAKQDLKDISQEKDILSKLEKNSNLQNVYNIAQTYIPETQQSGDLVIELSAIAGQNNLKVEQFSIDSPGTTQDKKTETSTDTSTSGTSSNTTTTTPTTKTDSTGINEIKFSVKLTGTFTDFINFLKGAETNSRLISINTMTLTQATAGFSAQITGKAYWQKASTADKTLANINLTQDTINKFLGLKTYGSKIDLPTESGFGRTDPFSTY
jgi:Tfp pilus assembly protein PilO